MDTDMEFERFQELIAAYGAEPRRWPEAEREQALALLGRSPQAREALARAHATDALLDSVAVRPAPLRLRRQLLAQAPAARPHWRQAFTSFWRDLGGWQLAGPALAAGLALGVGIGVGLSPLPAANGFDEDTVFQLAGLAPHPDLDENWIDEP